MTVFRHLPPKFVLPFVAVALPAVLLYSSLRTLEELNAQRAIYLRHRVSMLVSRLEGLGSADESELANALQGQEPYLTGLRIISSPDDHSSGDLKGLWDGQELFRTSLTSGVFRSYVPFHSESGLRIAQIDLNPEAADFLLVHGRHNVFVATVSGMVLMSLSIYAMWSMKRAARLEVRQLELEHLAQIGTMAAVLAHEIRNPLGTIKGFVQLADERADAATRTLLGRAVAETERLENLVKGLLAYGRPATPHWRTVDWRDIAATAEAHARHLVGKRPISLEFNATPLAWSSDPDLLEQALLNLVRNAIEAIPSTSDGSVQIRADREESGDVAIGVSDTGPGFPESVRQRPFEPFRTTKAFGTGLGLPTARKIATSLGGSLEIRNRPGGGGVATLRFPGRERSEHDYDSDRG